MTTQAPSAATMAAARRLDEYAPESAAQARTVALRLWPKIDLGQLDAIISL